MDKIAALRYGKAIFDLSLEKNQADEYSLAAKFILDVLKSNPDFSLVLSNPSILQDEKVEFTKKLFDGHIPEDFMGLISLLIRRGRQNTLEYTLHHFDTLYMEYKKRAHALLYVAKEIDEDYVARIKQIVQEKIGKSVEIEIIAQPELMAGFRVEVDGFVLDASAKNQLQGLKKQLLGMA